MLITNENLKPALFHNTNLNTDNVQHPYTP